MSLPTDDYATRRAELADQIARQRGQLASAYRDLEKPIQYTEYGLRTVSFFRQNPWIFVAVPAAVNLASSLFGLRRKPAKASQTQQQTKRKGVISTCAGGAWQLFQLYRRVRPFFL
jgi:hypothetical protein